MRTTSTSNTPHLVPSATEGGRTRPTGVADGTNAKNDPEVVAHLTRRRLTNSYKLKVVNMVDSLRAEGNGAIGAYLRKEGIYYSMVHKWAHLRDQGVLTQKRTTNGTQRDRAAILAENKQLRRKLEQVEKRLHKSELLVELQKKISAILELDHQSNCEKSAA
jgi:transposase